ncbi:CRISPR-associated helicase Cas3' [Streptomyces sp. ZAF1911]|uniref:CRISPR-associated helicase Cas3' n=1 Tax=Streptomyces sp. ZAF1911 TaxID=2944129 RepID=UPI00237A7422|nr:CRISPR-associated helicase Cas3' [Streptomyces sp. ZAF1911]MDD9380372.1 CRISPR-associated helicase Cas3' [Streptomyces sp. ZAF1911]
MLRTCTRLGLSAEEIDRLGALWGKSSERGGGTMNLLLSHMLDTAAVAEHIWDHYLAPATRDMLDQVSGGCGRRFFAWVCGVHDCGKATPAFQRQAPAEAARLAPVGLQWRAGVVTAQTSREWAHDKAGGFLMRTLLKSTGGWVRRSIDWVCPMVSGHHGVLRAATASDVTHAHGDAHGKTAEWKTAQAHIVEVFTLAMGYESLADVQPVQVPARADQLTLLGFVIMADWIASDADHFPGIPDLANVSVAGARRRAAAAWQARRLGGGLRTLQHTAGCDLVKLRFGHDARASQSLAVDLVRTMAAPGLVFLEAPMGEGKTKTALAVAEVMAERFGLSGVFVGMPTQATSDPMFTNVRAWASEVQPGAEDGAVLLHGKRAFNTEWKAMLAGDWTAADARFRSVQEDADDCCNRQGPADWFLGPKRGLLAHLTVGTIDQLLYAATRTRHVMLRTAGLAGKVVILDEVHACDVYMSAFLKEALFWLGQARVPVILLSATLPPAQRAELAAAYMAGVDPARTVALPEPGGYPNVTCVWPGMPAPQVAHTETWRPDLPVRVRVLPEPTPPRGSRLTDAQAEQPVLDLLDQELTDGGCALIIRNTVKRAQRTYRELAARYGTDTVILHGQLTTAARADRTERLLAQLGPGTDTPRPGRLILVATQVAEQSFDIDADLIVTDLAPVDLLLQRVGRVHRHEGTSRPERLTRPTVYVTALQPDPGGQAPRIERGAEFIYGRHLLLRTAALVLAAENANGWAVPSQVPELVAAAYDETPIVPAAWQADADQARTDWEQEQNDRRKAAADFLLTRTGEHTAKTLDGLHYASTQATTEEHLAAVVRDGEMSIEVVLIIRTRTSYTTLSGQPLGTDGTRVHAHLDTLAGDMMRLPARLTSDALDNLAPLPGWAGHPWLRSTRALVLDPNLTGAVGRYTVSYDPETGLTYTGS